MRVLVDARSLASGRGVGRYTRRTLEATASRGAPAGDWNAVLPAGEPVDPGLPASVGVRRSRLPSRVLFGLGAATGRPRLDVVGGGGDVVWLPAPAPVAVSADMPYVLTLHDLSFVERPQDFTAYERAWHRAMRVDRLVARAAAVVCLTQVGADAVTERWPAVAGRLHVVTPGVDRLSFSADASAGLPVAVPRRFFLWVGALEPRKAPDVLAAAFARARAAGLDASLVVVGTGREAARLEGPGIVHLGAVDEATLGVLYAHAVALVMPSWLEGFGQPPLEAARHGTPSVLSDLPVFAETLGDASLRVAAGDVGALAAALVEIAGDAHLRDTVGVAARRQVELLTWERAAAGLHAVLVGVA